MSIYEGYEGPFITTHAADRWDVRTPTDSVSPEQAVLDAEPCPVAEGHVDADDVWYHGGTDTLLLQCEYSIVTVLCVELMADYELRQKIREEYSSDLTDRIVDTESV